MININIIIIKEKGWEQTKPAIKIKTDAKVPSLAVYCLWLNEKINLY